jgi:uncharacterized protein YegL
MEEKMTAKAPKQLISFIIDNSASCEKEKLAALMGGFRRMIAERDKWPNTELELICFEAFDPALIKAFDEEEIAPVRAGRMPLLGRAVMAATERTLERVEQLRAEGIECHRPWMFILSAGFTFDDMEEVVTRLDAEEHAGNLTYLPFKLYPKLFTERMQTLDRVKHMIEIREGGIEGFFGFIDSMLERRSTLSPETGLKFSKSDFEGWAVL